VAFRITLGIFEQKAGRRREEEAMKVPRRDLFRMQGHVSVTMRV
jgi:hypothetical protein